MGRGERDTADGAAVEKMRDALNEMEISGRIVIGEGERDEAPMLFIGEELGRGGFAVDIAVDPVEGTNLVANGLPNSIAVMAIAERGGLLHAPDTYMKKLAVGPKAAPYVHIDASVRENLEAVANALEKPDQRRHASSSSSGRGTTDLIREVREAGARIKLISDGDVDACDRDGDRGHRHPRRDGNRRRARRRARGGGDQVPGRQLHGPAPAAQRGRGRRAQAMGFGDLDRVLDDGRSGARATTSSSCATGITDGDLVRGVRFFGNQARTHSILIHSQTEPSGSSRVVHRLGAKPVAAPLARVPVSRAPPIAHFDLVVIGAGSGGYAAARTARDLGASVALVDHGPARGAVHPARLHAEQSPDRDRAMPFKKTRRGANSACREPDPQVDFPFVIARKRAIIKGFADYRIGQIETFPLYSRRGAFLSPTELAVGDDASGRRASSSSRPAARSRRRRCPGWPRPATSDSDAVLDLEVQPSR